MASSRLQGKVALITGAASGLGREIALNYASHGTKLTVVADLQDTPTVGNMNEKDDETTVERINRIYGAGKALFVKCNVTDSESVKAAIQEAVKKGGRLDIMVNNAGIVGKCPSERFHEGIDDDWDKIMSVNVKGVYHGSKHALAQMVTQDPDASGKRGRLLNIASIYGLVGILGAGLRETAYAASKGAVMNLSRTLALEYKQHGINVNALCPGFLKTAFNNDIFDDQGTNMLLAIRGGWGETTDIAHAATFLVSDEANWVHGVGLPVDGGYTAG